MKPFSCEVRQVLVDRRERRQAEPPADFLEARRVAVLLDEILKVIENLALALGQWLQAAGTIRKEKAKINWIFMRTRSAKAPRSGVCRTIIVIARV